MSSALGSKLSRMTLRLPTIRRPPSRSHGLRDSASQRGHPGRLAALSPFLPPQNAPKRHTRGARPSPRPNANSQDGSVFVALKPEGDDTERG